MVSNWLAKTAAVVPNFRNLQQRGSRSRLDLLLATAQSIGTGLAGQFILLLSGPLAARLLGVTERGYFAGLVLWPMLLQSVGSLSVPTACTYYLSRFPTRCAEIVGEMYRIAFLQSLGLLPLLAAVFHFWASDKPQQVQAAIWPMLLLVVCGLSLQYSVAVLRSQSRFTSVNILRIMPASLYALGLSGLFVTRTNTLLAVVTVFVFAYVVATIVGGIIAWRCIPPSMKKAKDIRNQLLSYGVRGHIGTLSPVENQPIDQAIVALFLTANDLGLYVVATAFTNLPRFISQSCGQIAFPAIAGKSTKSSAWRLLWRFFGAVAALNAVGFIVLAAAMPLLIHVFFGTAFAGAISVARILLLGTTLIALRNVLMDGIRGLGYAGLPSIVELFMYPWLLIGIPVLMQRYGLVGLALALTIGYCSSLVFAIVLCLHRTPQISRKQNT